MSDGDAGLVDGLLMLLLVFGAGWASGYGWALYRAVSWVERMRRWAAKVETTRRGEGIAWAEVDGKGSQ